MTRIDFASRWPRVAAAALAVALPAACDDSGRREAPAGTAAEANAPTAASAGDETLRPLVTLYKSPSCQCCAEWGEHLTANGFRVDVRDGGELERVRAEGGVTAELASCHSAVVEGYTIEGHVPADLIRKLLAERPAIAGLAVPKMPEGVPGMPDAGPNREPYQVLAFNRAGRTSVYAMR